MKNIPNQQAIDADLIRQQLAKLGANQATVANSDDTVFAALVKLWKNRKSAYPPTIGDIAEVAKMNRNTTQTTLVRLVVAGRVLRGHRRGMYVPRMDIP